MRRDLRRAGARRGRQQFAAAILLALLPFVALLQGFWVVKNQDKFKPLFLQFQIEKVPCDYCGGTGTVRDPRNPDRLELCPVCFGVGANHVRRISKKDVLCPACGGLGRLADRDTGEVRECERCAGRGIIRAGEEQQEEK